MRTAVDCRLGPSHFGRTYDRFFSPNAFKAAVIFRVSNDSFLLLCPGSCTKSLVSQNRGTQFFRPSPGKGARHQARREFDISDYGKERRTSANDQEILTAAKAAGVACAETVEKGPYGQF
jgi:hypothetical protein